MFTRAKRGLQTITAKSKEASDQEIKVAKNVTTSLAISLQELSVNFRKSQSSYLKRELVQLPRPPPLLTSTGGDVCPCTCRWACRLEFERPGFVSRLDLKFFSFVYTWHCTLVTNMCICLSYLGLPVRIPYWPRHIQMGGVRIGLWYTAVSTLLVLDNPWKSTNKANVIH